MTYKTPIEAWPDRKFRGKPGYSARHFAALAGAPEDPLRVAARILARHTAAEVAAEAKKLALTVSFEAVLAWQRDQQVKRDAEDWALLCESFEAVVDALELEKPRTRAVERLIDQARRAAAAAAAAAGGLTREK